MILAPVNQTIEGIIYVSILGTSIAIAVSIILAYTITNPIKLLSEATQTLTTQDWKTSIELAKMAKGKDEIGQLASSFEEMLYHLRNFYSQLDIRIRERTTELEWANEKLKHLDSAKTEFVESVAHDIRSPLTSILLAISSFQAHPNDPEKMIERISARIDRIQQLLSSIDALNDLDILPQSMVLKPLQLDELIKPIITMYGSRLNEVGIDLAVDIQPIPTMFGNAFLLERLFENLFTNAIKYTLLGRIDIHLYEDKHHIILIVKDTGIGIPEDEIPTIMQRYRRASNALNSNIDGTGIGLRIVEEALQVHNGTIKIESKLNVGTTITITLPSGDDFDNMDDDTYNNPPQ
ncbi:MAG: ATP-binding protein [Phototrophicaceae bacterium]